MPLAVKVLRFEPFRLESWCEKRTRTDIIAHTRLAAGEVCDMVVQRDLNASIDSASSQRQAM